MGLMEQYSLFVEDKDVGISSNKTIAVGEQPLPVQEGPVAYVLGELAPDVTLEKERDALKV
jgi:hypothetical protein